MPIKKKLFIFEYSHKLANSLMKKWLDIADDSINRRNRFTVALSGGKSPIEFYCKLSNISDFSLWNKTHLFFTDERFVSKDDKGSNFRMVKESLLNYINIPNENIHSIDTSMLNSELSANNYEELLKKFFVISGNKIPSFDFILLGMGEDGHIASLFPNHLACNNEDNLVAPVSYENVNNDRITITFPVINNAKNIIVIALGKKKANILNKVLMNSLDVPISKLCPLSQQVEFYIDKDAASELPYLELSSCFEDPDAICVAIE